MDWLELFIRDNTDTFYAHGDFLEKYIVGQYSRLGLVKEGVPVGASSSEQ